MLHCPVCDLVFVPVSGHVSAEAEHERYALHTNTLQDPGYVAYLGRMADVVAALPVENPRVLDFGSGTNAVLTSLLRSRGYDCTAYDPLYGMGSEALGRTFDIVVICEVIEHVRDLPADIALLKQLIAPQGHLVVHTKLRPADPAQLGTWWYTRDPTHINFFSVRSLEWLAEALGMRIVQCDGKDVAVIRAGAGVPR
jgi:ubiquinone/menaquinone biosynthesis C-methylase UbiE